MMKKRRSNDDYTKSAKTKNNKITQEQLLPPYVHAKYIGWG